MMRSPRQNGLLQPGRKQVIAAKRTMIHAISDALAARLEEFAHLLTTEQGKPLHETKKELKGAVAILKMLSMR